MNKQDQNSRFQNIPIITVFVLLLIFFAGIVFAAVKCYLPFSFRSPLSTELQRTVWSLMLLPAVTLPLALWLSNLMHPVFSKASLLTVLLTCCFVVMAGRLYKFGDASYIVSSFVFFLVGCALTVLLRDIIKKPRPFTILAAILTLLSALTACGVFCFQFVFLDGYFARTSLCYIQPFLCILIFLCSLCGIYSPSTLTVKIISAGLGCFCTAFQNINVDIVMKIFAGLFVLSVIWDIIDITKYIISRRKKNDSESCNA